MKTIIKSAGGKINSPLRGYCYNVTGEIHCDFEEYDKNGNRLCKLFGGSEGVVKNGNEGLIVCDRIYGMSYEGSV